MSGENEGKSEKKWLFSLQFLVDTHLIKDYYCFINGCHFNQRINILHKWKMKYV